MASHGGPLGLSPPGHPPLPDANLWFPSPDVLDMVDVIMEGNEGELEEYGPALSEDLITQTFPFSALVPAALDARNKMPPQHGNL